jgi:hypothetical protein
MHPVAGKEKSRMLCQAFADGCPADAKGHVFYGVDKSNLDTFNRVRASGEDWYYVDNSFFDKVRGLQFRVAKNRIQTKVHGQAIVDFSRFEKLHIPTRPMRDDDKGCVLMVEQSESFMREIACDPSWFYRTMNEVSKGPFADRKIKLRKWDRNKEKQQATLVSDLQGAALVVTHSSAAAVTAFAQGVPIIVSPMSSLHGTSAAERLHTFGVLAENQWSPSQMRNGDAWQWFNKN